MTTGRFIEYDLETHPLQIRTDAGTGSGRYLTLVLYTADSSEVKEYDGLGWIRVEFTDPIKYIMRYCSTDDEFETRRFPTPPPSAAHKIWTITKTSTTLSILCNEIQVLSLDFRRVKFDKCEPKWSQDVAKLAFWRGTLHTDSASREFRRLPQCLSLPDINNLEVVGRVVWPVGEGVAVTVQCGAGYTLQGDSVITCQREQVFTADTLPTCISKSSEMSCELGWIFAALIQLLSTY